MQQKVMRCDMRVYGVLKTMGAAGAQLSTPANQLQAGIQILKHRELVDTSENMGLNFSISEFFHLCSGENNTSLGCCEAMSLGAHSSAVKKTIILFIPSSPTRGLSPTSFLFIHFHKPRVYAGGGEERFQFYCRN